MSRPVATLALSLFALLGVACSKSVPAFEVIVNVGPGAVATCGNVAAWSQSGAQVYSSPFGGDAGPYSVAVYQASSLGQDVTVQAYGYSDSACTLLASESGTWPATFGVTSSVSLSLFALPSDGGTGMDSGTDAGGNDSGSSDSGTDAGMDAGLSCTPGMGCGANDAGICDRAGTCAANFPYIPSNFDPGQIASIDPLLVVDCPAMVDTTGLTGTGTFTICTHVVTATLKAQVPMAGNTQIALIATSGLIVTDAGSVTFQGPIPVIWAVFGSAEVDGLLQASGGTSPGPGVDVDPGCNAQAGTNSGGGGGGGFGTNGGNGGKNTAGNGGGSVGAQNLSPLEGGCSGGGADNGGGVAGNAGGALQVSSAQDFLVSGVIASSGQGGDGGFNNQAGGGGGGSGGGLLLEAQRFTLQNAGGGLGALTVNGGGGGGGDSNKSGSAGAPGNLSTQAPAPGGQGTGGAGGGGNGAVMTQNGMQGQDETGGNGSGGGGGGVGYIKINATKGGCNLSSGTTTSGKYQGNGPGC